MACLPCHCQSCHRAVVTPSGQRGEIWSWLRLTMAALSPLRWGSCSENEGLPVCGWSSLHLWLQEDSYVLPLRWCGLQVRMSCPLMQHMSMNPPMVTCHSGGMVVTTEGTNSASKIRVNGKLLAQLSMYSKM